MRAFAIGRRVGGRAVISRHVSVPRRLDVLAVSFIRTSLRHQSSSEEPPKATQWTQHSLNESPLPAVGNPSLPESSRETPTVYTAYIALGSNLGDRIGWIENACKEMSRRGIKIKRTSCLWETQPMYVVDQGSFINGVCEVSPGIRHHEIKLGFAPISMSGDMTGADKC